MTNAKLNRIWKIWLMEDHWKRCVHVLIFFKFVIDYRLKDTNITHQYNFLPVGCSFYLTIKKVTHTRTEHFIFFFSFFRTSVQFQHFSKPGCNFFFWSEIQVTEPQQPCLKYNTRQPERYIFLFHFRNCVAINILAITCIWAASHVIIP